MYKTAVIGHFGFGINMTDGQTVKTVTVTAALEKRYGGGKVLKLDTHGGAKALLKLPFQVLKALKNASNIIIFPAQRGLRAIVPLLAFFNRFYHRKLHYCVVGGWLPGLLNGKKRLQSALRGFYGIYTETELVKNKLAEMGFDNTVMLRNCKQLNICEEDELCSSYNTPYRVCTFSRVIKEKGIGEACKAVDAVNNRYGKEVLQLDIYGPVPDAEAHWFEALQKSFSASVRYCGTVDYDKSVKTLQPYFALLFPTRFYTEGIPGTIIDAYAAGVPVVSSRWQSFDDIVDDKITGIGYDFDNADGLRLSLEYICEHTDLWISLKGNCLKKARQFLPENALKELFLRLES